MMMKMQNTHNALVQLIEKKRAFFRHGDCVLGMYTVPCLQYSTPLKVVSLIWITNDARIVPASIVLLFILNKTVVIFKSVFGLWRILAAIYASVICKLDESFERHCTRISETA